MTREQRCRTLDRRQRLLFELKRMRIRICAHRGKATRGFSAPILCFADLPRDHKEVKYAN